VTVAAATVEVFPSLVIVVACWVEVCVVVPVTLPVTVSTTELLLPAEEPEALEDPEPVEDPELLPPLELEPEPEPEVGEAAAPPTIPRLFALAEVATVPWN